MKKKTIRLTESNLHRVIKNTVKRLIKEANLKYRPFDDYRKWQEENPEGDIDGWWDDARNSPEMQNEIGWSKLQSYPKYDTSDDENLNINDRPNQRRWNKEWDKDMDTYYKDQDDLNPIRKDFDDRWKSSKQLDKDANIASKRKLHRAGALNRDIPESLVRNAIRESVNDIRQSRYEGLIDELDYYGNLSDETGTLSQKQIERLKEMRPMIEVLGGNNENVQSWLGMIDELIETYS